MSHPLDALIAYVADDLNVTYDSIAALVDAWCQDEQLELISVPDRGVQDSLLRLVNAVPQEFLPAARRLMYHHWLATPLPLFVYGTLRAGQNNHHRIAPYAVSLTAGTAYGVALYVTDLAPWPHALERGLADSSDALTQPFTRGDVIDLVQDRDRITTLMADLDGYEDFNHGRPGSSEYVRVQRLVHRDGQPSPVTAWMYVARGKTAEYLATQTPLPSGDWLSR